MLLLTCDVNPPWDTFSAAWPLPDLRHLSLPLSPLSGLLLPTVRAELTLGSAGECHPDLSSPRGSAASCLRAMPGMGRDCPLNSAAGVVMRKAIPWGGGVTSDISVRDCQLSVPFCLLPLPPAVLAKHIDLQLTGTGLSTCPPQGQGQYPGEVGCSLTLCLLSDHPGVGRGHRPQPSPAWASRPGVSHFLGDPFCWQPCPEGTDHSLGSAKSSS